MSSTTGATSAGSVASSRSTIECRHTDLNMFECVKISTSHGAKEKTTYAYDQFIGMIQSQMERKLTKMSKQVSHPLFDMYEMVEKRVICTEDTFDALAKTASTMPSIYYPFLSFHGTRKPQHVTQIVKHGYLKPGEQHPTCGWTLRMATGNVFGDGIYHSFTYDTAASFGFIDHDDQVTLIVNIVIPGRIALTSDIKHHHATPDYRGVYKFDEKEFDTLLPTQDYIVSGNSSTVVPVALITLKPNVRSKWMMPLLFEKTRSYNYMPGTVKMYPLVGEYSLCVLPDNYERQVVEAPTKLQHYYVVPSQPLKYNKTLSTTIGSFVESTSGQRTVLFYGEHPHTAVVTKQGQFASGLDQVRASKVNHLVPTLDACLDELTDRKNWAYYSIVYIFIDNPDIAGIDDLIKKYEMYLKVKYISIKLIDLSNCSDAVIMPLFNMKTTFDSAYSYETGVHRLREKKLPEILDAIRDEVALIGSPSYQVYGGTYRANPIAMKIPRPFGISGEGMMTSLTDLPTWDWTSATDSSMIYKGRRQDVFSLNAKPHLATRRGEAVAQDSTASDSRAGHYKTEYINLASIEDPVERNRIFVKGAHGLLRILARFTEYAGNRRDLLKMYKPIVINFCEQIIAMGDMLQGKVDLSTIQTVFYHASTVVNEITAFTKVQFSGMWFSRLMELRFRRAVLKRAKHVFDPSVEKELETSTKTGWAVRTVASSASEAEPWTIMLDFVSPTAPSYKYGEMYSGAMLSRIMRDSEQRRVNSIVPVNYTGSDVDKMYLAYTFTKNPHLYIEGQHLALLTCSFVSLIEGILRRLHPNPKFSADDAKAVTFADAIQHLDTAYDMFELISRIIVKIPSYNTIFDGIVAATTIGDAQKLIQETNGVQSICQIIAILCRPDADLIFGKPWFGEFAFALIAEAVARSCKASLRAMKQTEQEAIQDCLAISNLDIAGLDNYSLDIGKSAGKTMRFFRAKFTNCSPFAIVSVIGFLKNVHHFKGLPKIQVITQTAQLFLDRDISMRRFLLQYVPGVEARKIIDGATAATPEQIKNIGTETTLALYLYGMKYHRAANRTSDFANIPKIISDIVLEQVAIKRKMILIEKERVRLAGVKNAAKLLKRQKKVMEFAQHHSGPIHIFTKAEVAALNAKRPADDQLEWLPESGLLMHHCCYPSCPDYLVNMCTVKDEKALEYVGKQKTNQKIASAACAKQVHASSKRQASQQSRDIHLARAVTKCVERGEHPQMRNGLMNHLQYDRDLGLFHSAFHKNAKSIAKGMTFAQFSERMTKDWFGVYGKGIPSMQDEDVWKRSLCQWYDAFTNASC